MSNEDTLATSSLLARTATGLIEAAVGLTTADKSELIRSAGQVFRNLRAGQFLGALQREWEYFRTQGRINNTYETTPQKLDCMQELLDFLDTDIADEHRCDALKKVLLVAATEQVSDRTSVLPQQYMRLVRSLSSGELLVLLTSFAIAKANKFDRNQEAALYWLQEVARTSGLQFTALVETHESALLEKRLLSARRHSDRSGVSLGNNFRLTDLAMALCEYIQHYEKVAHAS